MNKKIIIAPLNWGLGHATRCIPIINELLKNDFTPVIASDGVALNLLRKEFTDLPYIELPSYEIIYSKNLKATLLKQTPKILKAVKQEEQIIKQFVLANKAIVGIISDNRFGVRHSKLPSVYITHQLNVLSGWSTFLTSKIHKNFISKFDECWIPDEENSIFSGKLSSSENLSINSKFIGILSRFNPEKVSLKNDILIILSGPEPNRTGLEVKLLDEFKNDTRKIVLVKGNIEGLQKKSHQGNITIYNFLLSKDLEKEINQSELIVCRSGYSSIMDLAQLGKKAFFIPTKGQNEQEYLAKYLEKNKIAPFSTEKDFLLEKLYEVGEYTGFKPQKRILNSKLLHLFKSE